MEDPALQRKDADPGAGHAASSAPEQVIYRRRQGDWLSDGSPTEVAADEPRTAARRAAIEVAKATLIACDDLTSDHSDDVGLLCTAVAGEFDMDDADKANLMAAAQLHDIGKVGVPESILQKPGPLADDEWSVIHEHTIVGERILGSVPELHEVARLVRHSHEHWDGSGYPDGLSGEQIPLGSRIILCADAFHAIRSPRPYRDGRSAVQAYDEIRAHSGRQFDPDVVDALGRTIVNVRDRRRAGRPFFSARAVLGNRRLAALLLALTVAGSAFAALHGRLGGGDEAQARPGPAPCADCFGAPESPFEVTGASDAQGRAMRDAARSRGGTGRSGGAPLADPASGAKPTPAARAKPGPAKGGPGHRRAPAGGAPGSSASPVGDAPAKIKVRGPRKVKPTKGPPPRGNAYGHEKRLENPHPPKPPPGLVRPRPGR